MRRGRIRLRATTCAAGAAALVAGLAFGTAAAASTTAQAAPLTAFSGAVGFGAAATGGAGGSTYHVTNLNDSGSGSFRDAVSGSHRIVVFDVGGYVDLASAVSVAGDVTIEGDTAPGQGIGFMGHEVSFAGSSNDIVRYVRFREGTLDSDSSKSSLSLYDASDMIFDHVSVEFGQWDDIDAVGAVDITIQDSLIADPIGQRFGAHTETGPFTWYHDIFANSHNRNPLAKDDTQFIDSVDYDYQAAYTAGNTGAAYTHDVVDDYFIAGPATTSASDAYYQMNGQKVYGSGNLLDANRNGAVDGSALALGGGATALSAPWAPTTASIATQSAHSAYTWDALNSGDLPRDQVDALVIADVDSAGTSGAMWSSQTQTGLGDDGYGTITG